VQIDTVESAAHAERQLLLRLLEKLRAAIELSLAHGLPRLAVSLDTARDALEEVLADPAPKSSRIAIARTRAEIALEVWRETIDGGAP
jgi:hypothetical protein